MSTGRSSMSRFVRQSLMVAAACAVLLFSCTVLPFLGKDAIAASNNCTTVGTWFGVGDSGTTWMDTVTPGSSATVGQMNLEWVLLDPTLGGFFPQAVRATNAVGVWEKVNERNYEYTWVVYALDAAGAAVFVARASGTKSLADCDHINITYVLELWLAGQDMNADPPFFCVAGTATETRMPLVQAVCQP